MPQSSYAIKLIPPSRQNRSFLKEVALHHHSAEFLTMYQMSARIFYTNRMKQQWKMLLKRLPIVMRKTSWNYPLYPYWLNKNTKRRLNFSGWRSDSLLSALDCHWFGRNQPTKQLPWHAVLTKESRTSEGENDGVTLILWGDQGSIGRLEHTLYPSMFTDHVVTVWRLGINRVTRAHPVPQHVYWSCCYCVETGDQ